MSDDPSRGHHKVFLGMAAGVGKTYRMLQEGRAELEAGRDVVIGYLEPHGRAETTAQAAGLEVVPRREVVYRDTVLSEMDLDAILGRAPELCLIDELAHTNAPGVEHEKRYEDVDTVLAAGVDVFSTVNVQHLESLSDQIADLTGTRVRETLPDRVLASASEVMLLDITPEALRERLRAGKIYPAERVEAALANFFTPANLTALREVSLRQVAEGIEAQRNPHGTIAEGPPTEADARGERVLDTAAPWAIGERLLALVTPRPESQRIVRRAWRSAQRLGAELDVLWVAGDEPDAEQSEQLGALRKLCSVLGAHLLVEYGTDVAAVAQRVARERGTTYVLIGTPAPRSMLQRSRQPLPDRLLRLLPGVDLRIVADRSRRPEEEER
ncbi:MAG TPA: histidine kinase [Solirubrobacteraceae bacterium]|jgi:two-component system sensor histidine kinase KdpD